VLDNVGADLSGHTMIERELNKAEFVDHVAAEYQAIASRAPTNKDADVDDARRARQVVAPSTHVCTSG
jgi:hypothetical protein